MAVSAFGCDDGPLISRDGDFPDHCEVGDPSRQRWGTACLCCHEHMTAAGSVEPGVAEIQVTDGTHTGIVSPTLHDNFFRHIPLTPPLTVTLVFDDGHEVTREDHAPHGDCNVCHDGATHPRLGGVR